MEEKWDAVLQVEAKGSRFADKLPTCSLLALLQIAVYKSASNLEGVRSNTRFCGFSIGGRGGGKFLPPLFRARPIDHPLNEPVGSQETIQFLVAHKPSPQRPSEVS